MNTRVRWYVIVGLRTDRIDDDGHQIPVPDTPTTDLATARRRVQALSNVAAQVGDGQTYDVWELVPAPPAAGPVHGSACALHPGEAS